MFGALRDKIFGNKRVSKSVAKSRLHFVLVQDRAGLTNEEMAAFRGELVDVIERYFEIDEQGFDIDYEREGDTTTLLINSPVIVKRRESIRGVSGRRPEESRRAQAGLSGSRRQRKAKRAGQQLVSG